MIFLDSNVVVAFIADDHERHFRSNSFIIEETRKETTFAVSPQVMGEAFRALTSPSGVEHPISAEEFLRSSERMLQASNFYMLSPGKTAFFIAVKTAVKLGVTSHRIFDLILYGTMREHEIRKLATFNEKHFAKLDGIELVKIP